MKKFKLLHRRTFLRGLYSTALSLPILDIMLGPHGEAFAQQGGQLPKFYYSVYAGLACTGGSRNTKNVIIPDSEGALVNLPTALSSLVNNNLLKDIQIISNLTVPYGGGPGQSKGSFHRNGHLAYLSGLNSSIAGKLKFDSPDVLIAKLLGAPTPLTLSVQASGYGSRYPGISVKKDSGELMPEINLQKTYKNLIGSIKNDDQSEEKKRLFEIKKRGTVLDLVKNDINDLKKSLGQTDKQKLDRHITMFRDLETKLSKLPTTSGSVNYCNKSSDPGPDKPIGRVVDIEEWRKNGQKLDDGQAYSGEIERAKVAVDLAYMAMTCGLSPVTNLYVTWNHPWLNSRPITGFNTDFHNLTHGGGQGNTGITKAHQWHLGIYSDLTNKIKNTQIGSKNMLEQTVGVYCTEGGHGRDYFTGEAGNHFPHSNENAAMILAGTLGGLKPGKHFNSNKTHHTKAFISILKAFGSTQNKLGDISGTINKLFSS